MSKYDNFSDWEKDLISVKNPMSDMGLRIMTYIMSDEDLFGYEYEGGKINEYLLQLHYSNDTLTKMRLMLASLRSTVVD